MLSKLAKRGKEMENSNSPFKQGEWVEMQGFKGKVSVLNGTICWVEHPGPINSSVFVVRHPEHETHQRIGESANAGLRSMPLETTDELLEMMIDWALDDKDEQEFYRLTELRYGLPTLF